MATANRPGQSSQPAQPPLSLYSQGKVVNYAQKLLMGLKNLNNFRNTLLAQDMLYARVGDTSQEQTRAELANNSGNPAKLQNIVVPVVAPQVESAKAYLVDMFLSSYPIFPVVSPPENADVGLQLETVMGYSAIYFQWARHLGLCFSDGLKHNIMAVEVDWKSETTTSIVQDATKSLNEGIVREDLFSGNMLRRISPYNLIFDPRVPPSEVHKRGEFAGYVELMTRIELKQMLLDLDRTETMNATEAFQTPTNTPNSGFDSGPGTFYIPPVNVKALVTQTFAGFDWLNWMGQDTKQRIRYQGMYEVMFLYVRIIPREFGITKKFTDRDPGEPQIYKWIIVNNKTLIYSKRMTNAHNMLPIIIGQINEDGLGLQTKSYADNAGPYQQLSSGLWNSGIASQRRKVYDRMLYDPSRINKADIDRVDPVARIPVKQSAYGTAMSEAIYVTPYRDEGVAGILGMAREVVSMADIAQGQNRVNQGQFQKGNKTRTEFSEVMGHADARPRMSAVLLGSSWFQPIKDILKMNILQYQPPAELFNQDKQKSVSIDPVKLRTVAWQFQLADGITPSDKFLNPELFTQALQFALSVPQAGAEWDYLGMFAYQLKMQGARWVNSFRRTPEQQQQYMQQQMALQSNVPAGQPQPQLPPMQGASNAA